MYLVLLRHTMDDLPIRLCKTLREAKEVANALEWQPTDDIRQLYGTDCSTPSSVCIVHFGAGGEPTRMTLVRLAND